MLSQLIAGGSACPCDSTREDPGSWHLVSTRHPLCTFALCRVCLEPLSVINLSRVYDYVLSPGRPLENHGTWGPLTQPPAPILSGLALGPPPSTCLVILLTHLLPWQGSELHEGTPNGVCCVLLAASAPGGRGLDAQRAKSGLTCFTCDGLMATAGDREHFPRAGPVKSFTHTVAQPSQVSPHLPGEKQLVFPERHPHA